MHNMTKTMALLKYTHYTDNANELYETLEAARKAAMLYATDSDTGLGWHENELIWKIYIDEFTLHCPSGTICVINLMEVKS